MTIVSVVLVVVMVALTTTTTTMTIMLDDDSQKKGIWMKGRATCFWSSTLERIHARMGLSYF